MNMDGIHRQACRLFHMKTNGVGYALGDRSNACTIFHNDMHFDLQFFPFITHVNAAGGMMGERRTQPLCQTTRGQADDSIRLEGCMLGNRGYCILRSGKTRNELSDSGLSTCGRVKQDGLAKSATEFSEDALQRAGRA
jgi:hypothetical protein